jgi:hypothetical protein
VLVPHQIVIHRWGWTLVLNPDGTTTAWNPDRTKVLHSHGPPALPVQGRLARPVRPSGTVQASAGSGNGQVRG